MLKNFKKIYLLVAVLLFTSSIGFAEGYNYQNINYKTTYNLNNTIGYKLNYNYGDSNNNATNYWGYIIPSYNYNYTRPGVVIPTPTVPTVPAQPAVPTVPAQPTVPTVPAQPTVPTVPVQPTVPTVPVQPTVPTVPVQPTVPTVPTQSTAGLSAEESEVVRLVNIERQKAGLSPFIASSELSKVARAKSQDMATNNYFSHTSPTYGSPFEMMKQFGIKYSTAGENIARGQLTAQSVVNGWMNSSGHRANILNPSFNKIGVGAVRSSSNGIYWTQMFTN